MKSTITVLLVLVCGCQRQGTSTPVILPDQSVGSVVECNHKADCFRTASRACGGAYTVLEANDQPASDFLSAAPEHGVSEYVIRCAPSTKEDAHAAPQE